MISHLFFDYDGTILDTHSHAIRSLSRALDELGYNINQSDTLRILGTKTYLALKSLGIYPGHIDSIRRAFWRYFTNEEGDENIKPCVSLKPLKKLAKQYKLIIISNSETKTIKKTLETFGVKNLFSEIYGSETFTTKDKMLKKLFRKHKISPKEAAYIGDRYSDIESARAARCHAIAIHNKCSWSDLETIQKEKPDYIIKDFKELETTIKKINKQW